MLDAQEVERQAFVTATCLMEKAITHIDSLFGEGYAKANPGLIGDIMKTAMLDQIGMYIRGVAETLEEI
ncbi:hypothetical protein EXW94_22495 [Enterobacter sp. JMULE2]|uniref:hypothetical protein n=1 Tax=Enterobacter sp. JMULE2 TaxID=2518340 RepID=UPI0015764B40|nr:hypothetical protein [Enterobacter sp. JMULE2]NTZ36205.1 hypothetical protein [Enterobacter sp. JMULE2]NTZ39610.1 hypothetical protein [Enterobacter sp. JMULE2]NTZ40403.1 hypothetical protein [Enterobacter sp. JMULE2]